MASKPGSQQLSLLVLTEGSLDRWQVCFDLAPACRPLSNAFCMCRQVKLQLSDRGWSEKRDVAPSLLACQFSL